MRFVLDLYYFKIHLCGCAIVDSCVLPLSERVNSVTRKLSDPNDFRFGTIVPKRGTLANWNANFGDFGVPSQNHVIV